MCRLGQLDEPPLAQVLRPCQREGALRYDLPCVPPLSAITMQTVDIAPSASGVSITTRKKGVSPHVVKKAYIQHSVRARSGDRRAAGVTAKIVAKKGYRPDLRTVSSTLFFASTFLWSIPFRTLRTGQVKPRTPTHHLEPAGPPQGIMKVGCGHDVQDCVAQRGPIKSALGTPHVAIGYRTTLAALARLFGAHMPPISSLIFLLLLLSSTSISLCMCIVC